MGRRGSENGSGLGSGLNPGSKDHCALHGKFQGKQSPAGMTVVLLDGQPLLS